MNKNKFLNHKLLEKSNIALICILGMMAGFLAWRLLLSLSTFAFCFAVLYNVPLKDLYKDRWRQIGCIWVLFYPLSALWSRHTGFWEIDFNMKIPIMILPVAFAFMPKFSQKQLNAYTICTGIMMLLGATYSTIFLIDHMDFYMEQYRTAKILPTPVENDYIRFSLAIVFYIIWCVYVWPRLQNKAIKYVVGIVTLLLFIYLHVLASKSGLLSLYLFSAAFIIYLAFTGMFKKVILFIIAFSVLVFAAYQTIPTFKQRIGYVNFTILMFEQGDRSGHYGDIGRLISYKIALRQIMEHPWIGSGGGDVLDAMKDGYSKWYPQVDDSDRLKPHNQFLDVALACGIPAALFFSAWVLIPVLWIKRNRDGFFMFIVWFLLLVSLMIEPFLEIQFGVFVYLFFLLWQKATLKENKNPIVSV